MENSDNITVSANKDLAVPCIICGTFVNLNDRESLLLLTGQIPVKVCRECKDAVAKMKYLVSTQAEIYIPADKEKKA